VQGPRRTAAGKAKRFGQASVAARAAGLASEVCFFLQDTVKNLNATYAGQIQKFMDENICAQIVPPSHYRPGVYCDMKRAIPKHAARQYQNE